MIRSLIVTILLFTAGYIIANYVRNRVNKNMDSDMFIYLFIASSVVILTAIEGAKICFNFIHNLLF